MSKRILVSIVSICFLIFLQLKVSPFYNQEPFRYPKPILHEYKSNNTIWISMGLCFDEHANVYGKNSYPYAEVTPLAIKLWKYFRPNENIYIKVTYAK